jgi:hypothetical protein
MCAQAIREARGVGGASVIQRHHHNWLILVKNLGQRPAYHRQVERGTILSLCRAAPMALPVTGLVVEVLIHSIFFVVQSATP